MRLPNYFLIQLLLLCLVIISFQSCVKESISGSNYNLHAYVTNAKPIAASFTQSILTDNNWETKAAYPSKMILLEDGIEVTRLTSLGFGNFASSYIAKANKKYIVMAIMNGNDTVYGETVLPNNININSIVSTANYKIIDSIYFDNYYYNDSMHMQDTFCFVDVNIKFQELAEQGNVYQLTVKRIDKSGSWLGWVGNENEFMGVNISSEPELDILFRRNVNPYYRLLSDYRNNGGELNVHFMIEDYNVLKFPVHYEISFVKLSDDTYRYYDDLESREGKYGILDWDMGFKIYNQWSYTSLPGFVPCSTGNPIVHGKGFIASSTGVTDTLTILGPQ